MPENASTRTTDRDRLRSRPVSPRSAGSGASAGASTSAAAPHAVTMPHARAAQARASHSEQSPVLFRLPAIGLDQTDEFAATSGRPHSLPSHSQASHSLRSGQRNDAPDSLDIARVEFQPQFLPTKSPASSSQASSSQVSALQLPGAQTSGAKPSGTRLPSQLATQEPPVDQPAFELSPLSPPEGSQAAANLAAAAAAAPTDQTTAEQRRTWWEHWSSGVVLILLVIALVVASIIALNDGSKLKADQLAGQTDTPGMDEFDLSSIAIPDISMPPLNASSGRPLTSITQSSPSATSPTAGDVAAASAAAGTAAASTTAASTAASSAPAISTAAESLATEKPTAENPAADKPAAADSLVAEKQAAEKSATEKSATERLAAEKVATENLAAEKVAAEKVAAGKPAADAVQAGQAAVASAALASAEPAMPLPLATLDRPTELAAPQLFPPQELPGTAASTADSQRVSGLPVSNPNASLEVPRTQAVQAEGASPTFYDGAFMAGGQHAVSGAAGPVDTNLPSMSTVFASATGSAQATTPPATPVVESATPNLNRESIVEAYLHFRQLHQATAGAASNRYPDQPVNR